MQGYVGAVGTKRAATVLQARGRRLCKIINAGGETIGYDAARTFDLHPVPLASLADLHDLLNDLARRTDCALVRGEPLHPDHIHGVRRLLHTDHATGDAPTLREVPRRWVALDLDGLELPAGTDPRNLAACARAVLLRLPVAFAQAACAVQATAGHAIKPGARLRLWYWLSRPVTGGELKAWLKPVPVDPCVFGAAQPIYTAAPLFAAGVIDPLPARLLWMHGEREAVQVPPAAVLAPVRRAPALLPAVGAGGSKYAVAALSRAAAAIRAGASARHPMAIREALGMARLIRAGLLTEAEVRHAFAAALKISGRNAAPDEAEKLVAWGLSHAGDRPLPEGIR